MVRFSNRLGLQVRATSNGYFNVLYELTKTLNTKTNKVSKQEKIVLVTVGKIRSLEAVKQGRTLVVTIPDRLSRISPEDYAGTPFSAISKPMKFKEFESFAIWFASSGYYYQKPIQATPLSLSDVSDLVVSPTWARASDLTGDPRQVGSCNVAG